jgi:hypothetical protein
MGIFFVEIENDLVRQSLLVNAEDFVGATMQATDFVRKLDEAASEEFGELGTKINTVNDTEAAWLNDDGLRECIGKMKLQQGCGEEE